jgi:hypothetical protein
VRISPEIVDLCEADVFIAAEGSIWQRPLLQGRAEVSVDFLAVPTTRFQILYVFLVLAHERRLIVHFAVTAHSTAEWTSQQLREAFPWDTVPRYLLRDHDRILGKDFVDQVKAMGIKRVLSGRRGRPGSVPMSNG